MRPRRDHLRFGLAAAGLAAAAAIAGWARAPAARSPAPGAVLADSPRATAASCRKQRASAYEKLGLTTEERRRLDDLLPWLRERVRAKDHGPQSQSIEPIRTQMKAIEAEYYRRIDTVLGPARGEQYRALRFASDAPEGRSTGN